MALTVLFNKIMKHLHDGDIVLGLFLDLCKLLIQLIIKYFLIKCKNMGSEACIKIV